MSTSIAEINLKKEIKVMKRRVQHHKVNPCIGRSKRSKWLKAMQHDIDHLFIQYGQKQHTKNITEYNLLALSEGGDHFQDMTIIVDAKKQRIKTEDSYFMLSDHFLIRVMHSVNCKSIRDEKVLNLLDVILTQLYQYLKDEVVGWTRDYEENCERYNVTLPTTEGVVVMNVDQSTGYNSIVVKTFIHKNVIISGKNLHLMLKAGYMKR